MRPTVLVTRSREDLRKLEALLEPCGLAVKPFPVLRVETVEDGRGWKRVERLLARSGATPGWIVLASPRAPSRLVEQARRHGAGALLEWPAAAVGPGTAGAAREAGLAVELTGPGTGAGLARELVDRLEAPTDLVFAAGRHRRPELPRMLEEAGHRLHTLEVYHMRQTPPRELPPLGPRVDVVVLTSPRSARYYLEAVGGRPLTCPHWALGATTRDAAAAMGIQCRIPPRPDMESLAEELCRS